MAWVKEHPRVVAAEGGWSLAWHPGGRKHCVWGGQSGKDYLPGGPQKRDSNHLLERLNSCQHKLSSLYIYAVMCRHMQNHTTLLCSQTCMCTHT